MTFKNFLNLINPQPKIGGLEISDAYLRFVFFNNKKADFISVKLPPGVIEGGRIKDKEQFFLSVSNFYGKLPDNKKKKYIIANISDVNVYTETFSLPKSSESNIEEAAVLNLKMISPIDFENAYYDWEMIGEKFNGGMSQLEILGAFTPKQIVDDYEDVLSRAGFSVVAIEFPAIALARAFVELGEGFYRNKNYILMRVGSDGLAFSFIKGGNLYFLHFTSWSSAYGDQRNISFDEIKKIIISETQKVLSFYETHSNEGIESVILISPTLTQEISKIITDNFPGISIREPSFREFSSLEPVWASALGSALRGVKPRSEDLSISLLSSGTEEKFKNYQISAFILIWRKIILSVLAAIIIFYGGLDFIIAKNSSALDKKLSDISIGSEISKINELQKQAGEFNQKADLIYYAYNKKIIWSSFFKQIGQLSGSNVIIKRVLIQSPDSPILLSGEAEDENKIIAFKNSLESQPQFKEINLQLSNVSKGAAGKLDFTITFELQK